MTDASETIDELRDRLARAMVLPLGHDPAADWSRTYVGNGMEADGSLRGLCYGLADVALKLTAARVAELEDELSQSVRIKFR